MEHLQLNIMDKKDLVEIARSFSYKLNLGNYQTADFFCSQKAEVPPKDAEETSQKLYQFCKDEVVKSIQQYLKERQQRTQEPAKPESAYTEEDLAAARERMWPGYAKQTYKYVPTQRQSPEEEWKEAAGAMGIKTRREDGLKY